ncbi:MAG: hypothetical protein IRY99_24945, partial [Isosphaeraceae bacterium]|nr:hypothetical protein [Isosphaeraceae bacterium]
VLANQRGSVTLDLLGMGAGPRPSATVPLGTTTKRYQFVVKSGTGPYTHLVRFGTIQLTRTNLNNCTTPGCEAGPFTLVIR